MKEKHLQILFNSLCIKSKSAVFIKNWHQYNVSAIFFRKSLAIDGQEIKWTFVKLLRSHLDPQNIEIKKICFTVDMQEAQISELRLGYNELQLLTSCSNKKGFFTMCVCKIVSLH